jgi:ketosteroid isomerase-like protein
MFANEAFYVAFAARDLDAMIEVWSRREMVTCIHPGAITLLGRDKVIQSWQAILSNPASPAIFCRNPTAHLFGDVAYVLCWEQIEQAFLLATNIFVREDGRWRMVHHQAAAAPTPNNLSPTTSHPLH